MSKVMRTLPVLFITLAALQGASADWLQGVAITNLFSQGTVLFFTYKSGGSAVLAKGTSGTSQRFNLGASWPSGPFTIQSASTNLFLDYNGGPIKFKTATGLPAQSWTYDAYGRLKSSGMCIDAVNGVVSSAPLSAVDCSDFPSQEWVVQPQAPPPTPFQGYIYSIEAEGNLHCLDTNIGQALLAGVTNPLAEPTLMPCDGNPGQLINAIASDPSNPVTGAFPNGIFSLQFQSSKLCVVVAAPFLGLGLGRAGLILAQTNCSAADVSSSYFYSLFLWNSRSQLQSELYIDAASSFAQLPVCLATNGTDGTAASDCSYKALTNRWLWSRTVPV